MFIQEDILTVAEVDIELTKASTIYAFTNEQHK